MTSEAQRMALAEWCGWTKIRLAKRSAGGPEREPRPYGTPPGGNYMAPLPHYSENLDAIHRAEYLLTNEQRRHYIQKLIEVHPLHYDPTRGTCDGYMHVFFLVNATATQRLEALLKTIGKWE